MEPWLSSATGKYTRIATKSKLVTCPGIVFIFKQSKEIEKNDGKIKESLQPC